MNRGNQILAGLLALQAVLLIGMNIGSDDRMAVKSQQLFGDLDVDQVTRIEIEGPPGEEQESVTLARTGNDWVIATADDYPAKTEEVDELLDTMADLRSTTVVVTRDTYHDKLKVSEDDFNRHVTLTVDGEPVELFIGTSPSFKNTHVRLAGSDDVYLVPDLALGDVAERAWNWVERSYVDIAEDEVWSVDVENEQGRLRLDRDPVSGLWAAVGSDAPLKKSAVDDLVRKARSINLEAPVGKTVKPEHGLEEPEALVRLTVGTSTIAGTPPPTTETRTIRIGAKVEGQSRYYVKADDNPYVVEAEQYAVKPLVEKGIEALREDASED